jgi:pyridoxamine 5'-phosphate oxidase
MQTNDIGKLIQQLRVDYNKENLDENSINKNPLKQFEKWLLEAVMAKVNEPNAMVISTVAPNGRPSSRVVLLREFDDEGLGFYTNFQSRKGIELAGNKYVSLNFFWPELERQIRIEGVAYKQSDSKSDAYFSSRPHTSKVGAWASKQSSVIPSRKPLEETYNELLKFYTNKEVPRPPYWGGYLVKPDYYEFWQGRSSRLHDRIFYRQTSNGNWEIGRLSP